VSSDRLFGPTRGLPETPWGPFGAAFLVILVSIVAALLTGLMIVLVVFAFPEIRQAFQVRCTGEAMVVCIMPGLAALNLLYFFTAAGIAVASRWKRGATTGNTLMLRSPGWAAWQYGAFGILTILTLVLLQQLLYFVSGQFGADPGDSMRDLLRFREMFGPLTPSTLALLVLLAVVLAPAAEEFVFRGVLFTALGKRLGPVASAVILSAIWSLMLSVYSSQ
jgi:membrane protease YdiL (CAAX protease family)